MNGKKHNLVYRITNLVNGKIYIGRHITNNIYDKYMGSGYELTKAIKKYGRDNFKKEILFDFDNPEEMIAKENELLSEDFVKSANVYNIVIGGSSGRIGKPNSKEVRDRLREINTGFVTAKDKTGNTFRISTNDSLYLSGEFVHMSANTVCVKDSEGNRFRVSINDSRYLTGELVSFNLGNIPSESKRQNQQIKMIEYWKENTHSSNAIEKMKNANIGRVTVRDKDGNVFRTTIDDPRLKTGELINNFLGTKLSEEARKKISKNKNNCVWISNVALKRTKLIKPETLTEYISKGWIKYRLWFNKPNWEEKLMNYLKSAD